jgi:hypothetical protein
MTELTLLQTERDFMLPRGYLDDDGTLHREGTMRLATAADEILPLREPSVQKNPAYLTVVVLSRVVTRLGSLTLITPSVIEKLFAVDVAYLQDLYNEFNSDDGAPRLAVSCPRCGHDFEVGRPSLGGL